MPILTLTTDFGLVDHFVGTMKGVILGICPRAQIVDISHEVNAFEICEAAFVIAQAYPYFPKRTVHVVIVDPGVGTARRPLLAEAGGHYFIAPDNGVLSMVLAREPHKVRSITAEKYFLQPVSRTFHGRDVFAPVAAHLAAGVRPSAFGKLVDDWLRLKLGEPVRTGKRMWSGAVLKIDRFGNLITNFRLGDFPQLAERPFEIAAGPHRITRLARTYGESPPGEPVLIEGSSGYLEVAINQGSAAKSVGYSVGAPLELIVW